MSARDRWRVKLTCPKCGASGIAEMSEYGGRWLGPYSDIGFSVDAVSEGFRVVHEGKFSNETTFKHTPCEVVF